MPKLCKFSIWDDCIKELIKFCLNHEDYNELNISNFQEKDFINYFYTKGLDDFRKAEEAAIDESTSEYLKEIKKMPPFFLTQILGNKFIAFQALRNSFIERFLSLTPIINDIYDYVVTLAISDNIEFFKLEALARTKRSNYFNLNLNIDESNARLIFEFNQLKDESMDPKLITKIDHHVIYLQKVISSDKTATSKNTMVPPKIDSAIKGNIHTLYQSKRQSSPTVPLLQNDALAARP